MGETPLYPLSGELSPKSLVTHEGWYRATSLIKNSPPLLGTPQSPRQSPTVGSYGGAVSYGRGTTVLLKW